MLNVYKNYGTLGGLLQFNLAWNPLWMLMEAVAVVVLHALWPALLFVLLFGAFWVLAIKQAQSELALRARRDASDAELQAVLDRIFDRQGRKDDAA